MELLAFLPLFSCNVDRKPWWLVILAMLIGDSEACHFVEIEDGGGGMSIVLFVETPVCAEKALSCSRKNLEFTPDSVTIGKLSND